MTSAATAFPNPARIRTRWPTTRAISRRFWIELGVGRATIVGLSIGGVIAQEFYRQRPERVAALVLCDTAAKIGTDKSWDQRIAEVERGGIEAIANSVLERWFTAEFRARRSAELAGMRAMLTRTPIEGYLAACGALKRADLRPYAGQIAGADLMPGRRRGRLHASRPG